MKREEGEKELVDMRTTKGKCKVCGASPTIADSRLCRVHYRELK